MAEEKWRIFAASKQLNITIIAIIVQMKKILLSLVAMLYVMTSDAAGVSYVAKANAVDDPENKEEGANITFEDVDLQGATYYDGADKAGLIATAEDFSFMNYNHDGNWYGFGVSATSGNNYTGDNTDDTLFNSAPGGGMQSEKFAVGCYDESQAFLDEYPEIYATANIKPEYVYVTNTACAYKAMTEGDSSVKKFDETDWLKLTISNMVFDDEEFDYVAVSSVDFYLAKDGKIVNEWTKVDLTPLGVCEFIRFTISSSVSGAEGVNALSYFALDNMKAEVTKEQPTGIKVVETQAAVKAKKFMKDDQIIIMKNGKQFNVAGQEM